MTELVFGRRYRVVEKIGSGGMAEVFKAVDEVLQTLGSSIEESGADISRGELPTAEADRTQIVQLLQNLVSNALRYTDKGKVDRGDPNHVPFPVFCLLEEAHNYAPAGADAVGPAAAGAGTGSVPWAQSTLPPPTCKAEQ